MATVRELTTSIGFKVDDKKLRSINQSMDQIKTSILAVGAAAAAAAAGLFKLASSTAEQGDNIAKTARDLGIGTDALQEYAYAANIAGISQGELEKGLKLFSRSMGQAAQGTGIAATQLEYLGITVRDANGEMKSNEVLLEEVGDKLREVEDASIRASISQDLFGRSGQRMGTFLIQNRDTLDELRQRAHELGIVIDKETLTASEVFTDSLFEANEVMRGLKNLIGGELLPVFTDLFDSFRDFVLINRELIKVRIQSFIEGTITFLKGLWAVLSALIDTFDFFAQVVGGSANALKLLFAFFVAAKLSNFIGALVSLVSALRAVGLAGIFASISTAPLSAVIFAITAAIVLLIAYWDQVKLWIPDWVFATWDMLSNAISGVVGTVIDAVKWVGELLGLLDEDNEVNVDVNRNLKTGAQNFTPAEQLRQSGNRQEITDRITSGTIGEMVEQRPMAAFQPVNNVNTSNSSRNVNVKSDITVNVPAGTSEEQSAFLKQAAREAFREEYENSLQNVLVNNPELE